VSVRNQQTGIMISICLPATKKAFKQCRTNLTNRRLQESDEILSVASNVYSDIIKEEPTNAFARKRKICVARAQGTPEGLTDALKQVLGLRFEIFDAAALELPLITFEISHTFARSV
jgi:hypothetical protein